MALTDFTVPNVSTIEDIVEPSKPSIVPVAPAVTSPPGASQFAISPKIDEFAKSSLLGNLVSSASEEQTDGSSIINQVTIKNPVTGVAI